MDSSPTLRPQTSEFDRTMETMASFQLGRRIFKIWWMLPYLVLIATAFAVGFLAQDGVQAMRLSPFVRAGISIWCMAHVLFTFKTLQWKNILDDVASCPGGCSDMAAVLQRYCLLVLGVTLTAGAGFQIAQYREWYGIYTSCECRGACSGLTPSVGYLPPAMQSLLGLAVVYTGFWWSLKFPTLTAAVGLFGLHLSLFWPPAFLAEMFASTHVRTFMAQAIVCFGLCVGSAVALIRTGKENLVRDGLDRVSIR